MGLFSSKNHSDVGRGKHTSGLFGPSASSYNGKRRKSGSPDAGLAGLLSLSSGGSKSKGGKGPKGKGKGGSDWSLFGW